MSKLLLMLSTVTMLMLSAGRVLAEAPVQCIFKVTNCFMDIDELNPGDNDNYELKILVFDGKDIVHLTPSIDPPPELTKMGQTVQVGCYQEKCDVDADFSFPHANKDIITATHYDACEDLWVTGSIELHYVEIQTTPGC